MRPVPVDHSSVSKLGLHSAEVLPSVVGGWEEFYIGAAKQVHNDEKLYLWTPLYNLVGLADQAEECLRRWEEVHFEVKAFGATELQRVFDTRVIRMLRTTANACEKHGNEQAGCMADFND